VNRIPLHVQFYKILAVCSVFSNIAVAESNEHQFSRELLLEFSEELFQELEYYRAITEFRRYLSYYPHDPATTHVNFRIYDCYFLGERYAEALAWGRRIAKIYDSDTMLVYQAQLRIGDSLLQLNNFSSARTSFKLATGSSDIGIQGKAYYGIGLTYTMEEKWQPAAEAFLSVPEASALFERAKIAGERVIEERYHHRKKPVIAALLNTVPGLGYIYVGQVQTGIAAFIVNSLSYAATYSAFKNDQTGLGTALGFLTIGWYTGGIYGARVGAYKHNSRMTEILFEDLYYP